MIEAIKQMVAELEYVLDCINQEQMPFDGDDFHEALRLGCQAIAELESQEPVAWADMGTRDVDNDAGLSWTTGHFHTTPLYIHPPQRTEEKNT